MMNSDEKKKQPLPKETPQKPETEESTDVTPEELEKYVIVPIQETDCSSVIMI